MAAIVAVAGTVVAVALSHAAASSCNASRQQRHLVAFKRNLQSRSHFCGVPVAVSTSWGHAVAKNGKEVQGRRAEAGRCRAMSQIVQLVGADIVEKVKMDHKDLEEAYSQYKAFHKQGNDDEAAKWFNQFVWEVSRHAVSEELVLYPLIAAQGDRGRQLADESRAHHQHTKDMLADIQGTADTAEFERKFDAIMAALRDHIAKEETLDLEFLKQQVDQPAREAAGTTFALGKNLVPTKPHAAVPNKSAAIEAALGLLVTPIDKLRDLFTAYPSHN